MDIRTVTDAIRYVGVDDNTLALFENQYPVQPMGVSYNSYVILDEKIAVMDSVDARAAVEWLSNVAQVLGGAQPRLSCGHTHGAGSFRQPHADSARVPGDEDRGKRENIYPDQAVLWHGCIVGRPYAGGWRGQHDLSGLTPAALPAGTDGTLAGGDDGV